MPFYIKFQGCNDKYRISQYKNIKNIVELWQYSF